MVIGTLGLNITGLLQECRLFFTDQPLDLDTLLIKIRDAVTPKWYQYGKIIGIPEDILFKCSNYPPEDCVVEILDYWLRNSHTSLTWSDVAATLKKVDLHQLAKGIEQN